MNSSTPAQPPSRRRDYTGAPALAHEQRQQPQPHDGKRSASQPRLQHRPANPPRTVALPPDKPDRPAFLSSEQAQLLITLRGQINAIRPPLTKQLDAIVAVFASLKESEHDLKELLRFFPADPALEKCRSSLSRIIGDLNAALGSDGTAGRIDPGLLTNGQIQVLCQGMAAGIPPTGSLLFYKNHDTHAVLRNLTDILLTRAMAQGLPEAVQANGEVLDILNWLSRGLKAGLLVASGPIDRCFGKALLLIHEWTGGDQCGQLLTDHNLGRCAVQLATIINHTGIDLLVPACNSAGLSEPSGQAQQTQSQTMGALLQRCVLQLCAPVVLKRLATAPVDAIALLNVCNMVKYAVEKRVLAANDPLLLPVLNLIVKTIGMLPEQDLLGIEGDCRPLSNFSNFLRTLAGHEDRQQLEFQAALSMLDPVCAHLLSCVNGQAFEDAWPSSQSLSNLISFVKFCDRMLERRTAAISTAATTAATSTTSTTAATPLMQAEIIEAARRLSAGVLWYGAAAFDGPPALSGLLAGLAYLWQRNLVPVTAGMPDLAKDLLARVGQIDAGAWSDKSKRVILPALNVLLNLRVITLEQAQAALARLLPASGSSTGQLTLQDMASEIARLGVVEDAVSALPMALPASAPSPALPPAISEAPRSVPGWTAIRTPPVALTKTGRKKGSARSKGAASRRRVCTKPLEAHTGRAPAQARSESALHSPQTVTASMPSYAVPATVNTQVQEVRTKQQEPGNEAPPVQQAQSRAGSKKSNNAKTPVKPVKQQTARANARTALSQAILAGHVAAVTSQFRQKASWSGKEITAVLHDVMGGIELIDASILDALDAFFTVVRQTQPEAGSAALTKYFKTHPPIFAGLPALLTSHGLIAVEDSIVIARQTLSGIKTAAQLLEFIATQPDHVMEDESVNKMLLARLNSKSDE